MRNTVACARADKLPQSGSTSYTLVEHRYLDELLDQLDVGLHVTFVIYDWGSALDFDWPTVIGTLSRESPTWKRRAAVDPG